MAIGDIPSHFVDGTVTATDDNSNSATLTRAAGDFNLSGFSQQGREVEISEARGVTIGARLGVRKYGTVTVTRKLANPADTWNDLIHGLTATYTSVLARMGDALGVDLAFSFPYSTDTRSITCADCLVTDVSTDENAGTESYSFQVLGAVTVVGTTGTRVYVPTSVTV